MLQARSARLQERVFNRLFQVAEVVRFSREEQEAYVQSRKYYWDLNNVIDTANLDGIEKGREAGREEGREQTQIDIILTGHQEGFCRSNLVN